MLAQHGSSGAVVSEYERITRLPILVLNAHARCNCRCIMCDIWKRQESAALSVADLERHREWLRKIAVEWIVLTGGEPLMHRDLRSLCEFFRELGIRLTLLTTGLLLQRRAAEVADLFDDIIISLDGPKPIHDTIRRVQGSYELIQSGIAAVRAVDPRIGITFRTTVQKANHAHLQETVRSAKALKGDGISFLAADVTSSAFNRSLLWPAERQSEVALSSAEVEILQTEVENLIQCFADDLRIGYIAENSAKLRRIVEHFRAHLGQRPRCSPQCNAPWVSAVVEADGTVRPCFFHQPLGNIHQASLEEIINGDAGREFRHNLDIPNNSICQSCVCSLYRETERGM